MEAKCFGLTNTTQMLNFVTKRWYHTTNTIRILVACEESQEVCKAFRAMGHEAYSCDIEPCSGGHPEWHLKCDALGLLKIQWDMILAFSPCTYLSNAGARHLFKGGTLNEERYQKGLKAKEFF